jgi:hypothetical protein
LIPIRLVTSQIVKALTLGTPFFHSVRTTVVSIVVTLRGVILIVTLSILIPIQLVANQIRVRSRTRGRARGRGRARARTLDN